MSVMPQPSDVRDEQIVVSACGAEQRAEQARLFNQCFKKSVDESALAWRYDRAPQGPSISFVARPPGGEAISGYACSPRRAIARGDESTLALVGETGDVMTHPDWRKRGFFSRLDRAAMEEAKRRGWVLAFGLPNRKSAHIFLELGWEQIGTVRSWTFLFDGGPDARAARAKEGRLQGLLAPIHARACARARARVIANPPAADDLGVLRFDHVPDEVVEISRAVERDFSFMIRRDAKYLRWRFLETPSKQHQFIPVTDGDERLVAYSVVQYRTGSTKGYLVDVLGLDATAVDVAISLALHELECRGAKLVEATAIDGSWWCAQLQRWGFLPPRDDNHLSVILYPLQPEHPLVAAARDTSRWYFTDGDRDDETMG